MTSEVTSSFSSLGSFGSLPACVDGCAGLLSRYLRSISHLCPKMPLHPSAHSGWVRTGSFRSEGVLGNRLVRVPRLDMESAAVSLLGWSSEL